MDKIGIGFTRGVVYSVAMCIRNGQECAGEFLWKESGFKKKDLDICDEYDSKVVRDYMYKRLG